jgi:penicillin-binding protein 1A
MARAFAVFGNQGRDVSPIAIRAVEDRNGRVVLDTEREVRLRQRRMGGEIQVVSPQNAYIMTSMMKKTVEMGSLYAPSEWGAKFAYRDEEGKRYHMPMAGKTGTPQNWSDAWAVGFSPYYTTAIWFGFDKPGNSLGVNLTGSTLAGPVWADFMREVHQGLPFKDFVKPSTGIIEVTVCAKSGLLKTAACPSEVTLPFLEGTQPTRYCDEHDSSGLRSPVSIERLRQDTLLIDSGVLLGELKLPELRVPEEWQLTERLTDRQLTERQIDQRTQARQSAPPATRTTATRSARTRVASPAPRSSVLANPEGAPAGGSNQPAPDFRGSDYEGAFPPAQEIAAEDRGADGAAAGALRAPEGADTGPQTAPSRNIRGDSPILQDDAFALDMPDYNPLLE